MTRVPGTDGALTGWRGGLPPSVVDPKAGRRRSEVPTPPHPDPTIPPDPLPPEPDVPAPDPKHSEPSDCGVGAGAPAQVRLDDLVRRPVNEDGRRIGTVEDVVLNCTLGRVLGVDVVGGGRRRFLPWVTLSLHGEELALTVPLNRVPRGLSLRLAHGTRLSETRHGAGLLVDQLGELRPSGQALASSAPGAA